MRYKIARLLTYVLAAGTLVVPVASVVTPAAHAAPSANRFGAVSPTNAPAVEEELAQYLNVEDIILDGGPSLVGVESTIVDCTNETPLMILARRLN